MTGLTLAQAQAIIAAALAGTRSANAPGAAAPGAEKRIAVAVCDAGGHPLALAREDGAPPLLAHIAQAKAFTCAAYGRPTGALAAVAADYPIWFHGISRVAQATMGMPLAGSKGGVIVRDAAGTLLGGVGVAGETGDMDDALAAAGIQAVGLVADAA